MPVVLAAPAQQPAKKLLAPEPPVPDILLIMLVLLHNLNTLQPPTKSEPFIYKPFEFTHSLFVPPGARIAVDVSVVVPRKLPKMMLEQPVVTQQPALQPMNMLLQPNMLQQPA